MFPPNLFSAGSFRRLAQFPDIVFGEKGTPILSLTPGSSSSFPGTYESLRAHKTTQPDGCVRLARLVPNDK
jgi:hypothetical protein